MKNFLLFVLVLTNAATGFLYWDTKVQLTALQSDVVDATVTRTSNVERDFGGGQCVKGLETQQIEKDRPGESAYKLGRSWKKYGQWVFEVVVADAATNETGDPADDFLCTYDPQSGLMYFLQGDAKERWMFY